MPKENMSLLDTCFSVDNLHKSFMEIRKNIHFKYNVQNYRLNELKEIAQFRESYRNGTYTLSDSKPFKLRERGRERFIQPVVFRDRVIIHAFCQNVLLPKLTPYLIYDNCASLKGKGIDKSLDRFGVHLQKYYFKHGSNDGYILQIDCRKFFDNLKHEVILNSMKDKLTGEEINFLAMILKKQEVDVSYMTDEEYDNCMNEVFNALEYNAHNYKKTGKKMMRKSIGIGSETSQIIGLYYLSTIDNYIKIVRGFKYYARYMDDLYVIHESKEVLTQLLADLKQKYAELGLRINDKKTQIRKLSKPITFLKTIYILTDTGKIIRRKCKDTFKRERIKLKKFAKKLENHELTYEMIDAQYRSWRGTITRKKKIIDKKTKKCRKSKKPIYHNKRQLDRMDKLYNELFIEPFIRGDYARC